MLKFNNLTNSQKRFVLAAIKQEPKLEEAKTITLKEAGKIYYALKAKRVRRSPKIGYPNWLFANNKISRGIYALPLPNQLQIAEYLESIKQAQAVHRSETIKVGKAAGAERKMKTKRADERAKKAAQKTPRKARAAKKAPENKLELNKDPEHLQEQKNALHDIVMKTDALTVENQGETQISEPLTFIKGGLRAD